MNKIALRLLYLLVIFKLSLEGQIQGGDAELDFSSAKSMTKIKFRFKLTIPLAITDYLKIEFPFPLQNLVTTASYAKKTSSGDYLKKPR